MRKKLLVLLLAASVTVTSCSSNKTDIKATSEVTTSTTSVEETTETTTKATLEKTTEETTVETTEDITEEAPEETTEEIKDEGESFYKDYFKSVSYSGAVLVARDGQVLFDYANGVADKDSNTGMAIGISNDTVFEMGSITKQFTAVAIMQLEEQGLLSTSDTLDKYIPEYKYSDKITIHQLLNMTSGVVDYITGGPLGYDLYGENIKEFGSILEVQQMYTEVCNIAVTPITFEDLLAMIEPYELHFEPGTEYEYSNTNYYFLGEIIERVTGVEYADYVRTNILEPLNITELYPDIDHLNSSGSIKGFGLSLSVPHQDSSISYAVGVMTGTTRGLLSWELNVLDGALLTKESWDKIFDGGEFGYGYGWSINDSIVSHSGMTLGYNAFVLVDRDTNTVVISLSNIQSADFDDENPSSSKVGMTLYKNIDTILE